MSLKKISEMLDRVAPKLPELKIANVFDFLKMKLPPREHILAPWLPVQGLAMIYAPRGVGKTHVALGIANAVASGTQFLNWTAPKPRGVLYLDGEMPATLMQERLLALMDMSKAKLGVPFKLLTPDLQLGAIPDLASNKGQLMLQPYLEDIDLIIVDNISTLCRSSKENEADSWLPVQEWALKMRASGKSILFIHHAGKGGNQRGTSKREDILDTVIVLKRPDDYKAKDGAIFQVHFEKARGFMGQEAEGFEAHLTSKDNSHEWLTRPIAGSSYDQIVGLANKGLNQKAIAEKLAIDKSNVSRHLKRATQEGKITNHHQSF
ncbi:MAG: AAA family ATPase [Gammaproteobacteria bacterium]